jgi:hypothetical protein
MKNADFSHPAALDSSGCGNHLFAYAPTNAPKYCDQVPAAVVPQTGAANRGCLDVRIPPGKGGYTRDVYSSSEVTRPRIDIERFPFSAWTIEASANFAETGDKIRIDTVIGKNGQPTNLPFAPLQLKYWKLQSASNNSQLKFLKGQSVDSSQLSMEIIDRAGEAHRVASRFRVAYGVWYHIAVTNDGREMKMYVKGPRDADYVLQDSTPVQGALIYSAGEWTIGRGCWLGAADHGARAMIDEVRITAAALKPELFLFHNPELPGGQPTGNNP